ncbi:flavonoid 3'-monooxygenase-like [Telopea speciosissima]|uniref:flavonoid 3'-monooxygenase-like n=1 Tax=Telopea speciosissima TaxID=54955 RepID=UPI001CC58E91|nr:flavonoid 3'-monooxygenase-like [Telopea speciosissima]
MSSNLGLVDDECSWWWYGHNNISVYITQVAAVSSGTALLLAVLVVCWWVSKRWNKGGGPTLPPGPRGLPLVGNLPFLEPDLHRCFAKLAQIYGPIMKLQLGPKLCVVLTSPSLAREVLKVHDAIFANRDPPLVAATMTYGGIDIVWSPNGPQWRMMRRVFAHEMMSNKSLEACYNLRRQEVVQMVKEVYTKIGSPINIGEVMFLTMANLILSMLWGGTLQGDEKSSIGREIQKVMRETIDLAAKPNISDFFPILASFDIQGIERKAKKLLSRMNHIIDPVINQRLDQMDQKEEGDQQGADEKKERKDFLQYLLELKQRDGKASLLTKIQLKVLLQDIIGAGTDTTSTTVEWAMAEMIQYPEVMRKAQDELEQVVGMDNIVEESHLPKLSYLNAVVKESHRLHPPLPLMFSHCPSMSCTIGGYTILKGTNVFVNVWAMHRDPNAWESPLTFLPERFLSDSNNNYDYKGTNFSYLPFGSGRRMCAGVPLAEKMSLYVLASLLHTFKWKLPDGVNLDLSEEFGIVLKKKTPLVLTPTPRLSNVKLYS